MQSTQRREHTKKQSIKKTNSIYCKKLKPILLFTPDKPNIQQALSESHKTWLISSSQEDQFIHLPSTIYTHTNDSLNQIIYELQWSTGSTVSLPSFYIILISISIYGLSPLISYSISSASLLHVTACGRYYDNPGCQDVRLIILLPMNGMESRDSSRLLEQEVWRCSPRRRMCISRRASLGSQHATTSAVESAPSSFTARM